MGQQYSHLDIRERAMIEMNLALGKGPGQIAVYLSRSRSTITREIARNGWRASHFCRAGRRIAGGGYRCEKAEQRAEKLSRVARVERKLRLGTAPPTSGRTQCYPGRPQVNASRLATNSRRRLDPTQGPTKTPQRDHLFLLRFFQDITHANRG